MNDSILEHSLNEPSSGTFIVEMLIDESRLDSNSLNEVIRDTFEDILIDRNITPASLPQIERQTAGTDRIKITARFVATLKIEVERLHPIRVECPVVEVVESDIDQTIHNISNNFPSQQAMHEALGIQSTSDPDFRSEIKQTLEREAGNMQKQLRQHALMGALKDEYSQELTAISELTTGSSTINDTAGISMITAALVAASHIYLDPATVREYVETASAAYDDPAAAVDWHYSHRIELARIEAQVIHDLVTDWGLQHCNTSDTLCSFNTAVQRLQNLG